MAGRIELTTVLIFISTIQAIPLDGKYSVPANYSKFYRPIKDQSKQMLINTGMVIIQMVDIDFEEKSVNMNVEFIMDWQDQFIQINQVGYSNNVRIEDISKIWSPDLYIYGLKTFTKREGAYISLKRDASGYVKVSHTFEANVVIQCDPDFQDFPFHKQECPFKIASWTKTEDQLKFVANNAHDPDLLISKNMFGYKTVLSYLETTENGVKNPKSKYSAVGINIELTSLWDKYILLYYLPTLMMVVTSWFFYLLPSTSYPARTALLVTVFLLLINIYNGVVNDTPNSDGMTALEEWALTCVVCVFGTLLTYAIILGRDQMIIQGVILNDEGEVEVDNRVKPKSAWSSNDDGDVGKIQPTTKKNVLFEFCLFLIIFSGFSIFNIIYWTRPYPAIYN